MKDQLFLLAPGFSDADGNGPYYCGDSVGVEGLLSFFPALRAAVDVNYVAFPRPRSAVVALLGEARQSMPVLVLAADGVDGDAAAEHSGFQIKSASGRRFIDDPDAIRRYLSTRYQVAQAT